MAVDKKISELAFGKNIRNNFLPMVENGVNKRLYLQTLSKRFDILNKTQDYNIKQADYRNLIVGNCNQDPYGELNLYLPTGANAIIGYPYQAQHGIYQGFVKINVKGGSGNKILYKGQELDYFILYSKGQKIEFLWDGNYWIPEKKTDILMHVGYAGRSDYTAVLAGNAVTYDNKSAGVDLTGMVITEAASNFTAVIIYDSGGTGLSGILYYYELFSGFTFFTNNRVLTASNGITCDVNEASGSNKDISYDLYDGLGLPLKFINKNFIVSSDSNDNNSIDFGNTSTGASDRGHSWLAVSSSQRQLPFNANGLFYINNVGTGVTVNTQDWMIDIIVGY